MLLDHLGQVDDVLHEGLVVVDEVVGRKDGNDRVGIARVDPVHRQQDARPGLTILGLEQDGADGRVVERLGQVAIVVGQADDHRSVARHR